MIGNLALSIGSLVILYLAGEGACRVTGALRATAYRQTGRADLPYELVPGSRLTRDGVTITINRSGFRDREFDREKPRATVRIALVGDSVAFGSRVPVEQTYAKELERRLNAGRPGTWYEVLNFGMEGLNTANELVVLREKVLPYGPDVVILGYFLNDIHDASFEDLRLRLAARSPIGGLFLQRSCLGFYLVSKLHVALTSWHLGPDATSTEQYYQRVLSLFVEGGASWEDNQRQLREFVSIVRGHGARPLLAVFPFEDQLARAGSRAPQELLARFARAEGIAFSDVARGLERYSAQPLYLPGDSIHLSPLGHRVVAETLFEDLSPLLDAWGLLATTP